MDSLTKLKNIFKGDKVIWILFLLLCLVSVVEVYSSSSSLGYKSGNYWWAATYHTMLLGAGFFMMVLVANVKCKYFKPFTALLVPTAFLLLIYVLFFGTSENDASRWVKILFIPVQPSEIAKGAMIFSVAKILSAMQTPEGAAPKAMRYIGITAAFLILPIVPENLSTAVMLAFVVLLMMFIGRVPLKQLGYLITTVLILVSIVAVCIFTLGSSTSDANAENEEMHMTEVVEDGMRGEVVDDPAIPEASRKKVEKKSGIFEKLTHRCTTWKNRIISMFEPDVEPEKYDLDKNGQKGHANIAIVSSNIGGRGPGNSVQRDFLSQAFSDFIYAIIIEELGIEGALFVAFIYVVLLFRTGIIARRCKNPFPSYLAMGLALLMVTQAIVNMLVAVGMFPVTGQPLPLISKGGTSSIINCLYIGVILSISRTAARRDTNATDNMDDTSYVMAKARA